MGALAESRTFAPLVVLLFLAGTLTGCQSVWRRDASPRALTLSAPAATSPEKLEALADAGVDWHFAAVRSSWQAAIDSPDASATAWHEYNQSLAGLLHSAIQSGQLNPAKGLVIHDGGKPVAIPIVHYGFAWSPADFQRLLAPPRKHEPLLHRWHSCAGAGVPLVVERSRNCESPMEVRFFTEKSTFAATALLRFDSAGAAVLEFHNPRYFPHLDVAGGKVPIAADFTAPLAWTLDQTPRTYLAGFLRPGRGETYAQLMFLEPYQPGKIPIVVVHGLYSDPQSCADLINDLHSTPGFADNFQIWIYRYPSGEGILRSAAMLRDEMNAAVAALDPAGSDPAIRRMVLIGHSMGGLVAKLQVTYAEDRVWTRLANRPLEEIVTTDQTRAELARLCYFDPSPHVERVIFIATPHRGALPSSELLGSSASYLIEPPADELAMHQQLMADNPGAFNPLVARRLPTSVDMLAPDSPLLDVMQHMQIGQRVELHNVIGVSHPISCDGPSDGIVSIHSALHRGCRSLLAVGARHAEVHRRLETSTEVLRILDLHLLSAPSNFK